MQASTRWRAALQTIPGDQGKTLGPDHPDVATTLEGLVLLYRLTNRTAEADALDKRAREIRAMRNKLCSEPDKDSHLEAR
jgi:hypothetical protein